MPQTTNPRQRSHGSVQSVAESVDDPLTSSEEEESQEPGQSQLHCVFQLFAVDHAPLAVAVTLDTPCTSADALSAVQAGVDADFYRRFPRLVEVRPQPFPTWGCYLALPAWTHLEPIVLLDLSAYDGRCFAAAVPSPFGSAQLRRISLLPDSAEVDVFALGAPRPMQDDDLVEAIEGGSVVFKPRGARWVVQGTSLQLLLWRGPASWDPAPAFPVPPAGFNLLLVNPAGIRFLAAQSRPVEDPVDAIAALFGFHAGSPVVCPAQPPIAGVVHYGFPCDNVMAVEEVALGREPRPWAALVDCRPMLLGWDVVFSTADAWSFGDISVGIEAFCPPHWHPRILGERASSRRIPFRNGQVFTAIFARDGSADSSSSTSSRDDASDCSSCGSRDLPGVGGRAQEQPNLPDLPDATTRDRSRSPPPGAPAGPREADQAPGIVSKRHSPEWLRLREVGCVLLCSLRACSTVATFLLDGWRWFSVCAAARTLSSSLTSDDTPPRLLGDAFQVADCESRHVPFWRRSFSALAVSILPFAGWQQPDSARAHKWLAEPEPSSGSVRQALAALRYFAPYLGRAWRYIPGRNALFIREDVPSGESSSEEDTVVVAHFAVASIGYGLERLCINFRNPVTVPEVLQAASDARDAACRQRFPILIPASPQPCLGSGLLIAFAEWQLADCVVCIDASALDRRIFAARVPPYLDKQSIFIIADTTERIGALVFVGDAVNPLEDDVVIQARTGLTIFITPPDEGAPLAYELDHILAAELPWSPNPTFPRQEVSDVHCLAHRDGSILVF